MGLDMYLEKARRFGGIDAEAVYNVQSYLDYHINTDEDDKAKYTMEQWCGVSEKEVDKSVVGNYLPYFTMEYPLWDTDHKYGSKSIIKPLAQWRKANHIHKWFVDNVQDGVDECGVFEVTKEQLEALLHFCNAIIDSSVNGKVNEDVARALLPTQSGFFFGSTAYDECYLEDVKYTKYSLEKVLQDTDFEHEIVMYTSSW